MAAARTRSAPPRRLSIGPCRALWIQRLNAAVREHGLTYSKFIGALHNAGIEMDRKAMADIAMNEPASFAAIVEKAKAHLPAAA
jgi:large subunit ribosomal protein L20